MKAEHEPFEDMPFDEANERHVRQTLNMAYAAPPLSADFVQRLSRRLDEEFSVTAVHAMNGAAESCGSVPREVIRSKRRPFLRVIVTVAAAAALLVVIGLWNSRPAYGWAAMIEALERCEWVQAITRSAPGQGKQAAIAWVSHREQVLAREVGEARMFINFNAKTAENFDATNRTIYERQWHAPADPATEFLAILLSPSDRSLFPHGDLELVDESWRQLSASSVQLHVTLRHKSAGQLVGIDFELDSETRLPSKASVTGSSRNSTNTIEFSYPRQGPESIYALGVPEEAKVVAVDVEEPAVVALTDVEQLVPTAAAPAIVVEELVVADEQKNAAQKAAEKPTDDPKSNKLAGADSTATPAGDSQDVARIARKDWQPAPLPKPLSESELVAQVDALLASFWQAQGITPAEPATDTEFLRRVYLDLTGRIPTVSEVYAFLEDPRADRREHLIDDLLSRRDHATHLAAVWRTVLLPEGVDLGAYGGTNKFDKWLADRFGQNLPYDEIVRQLLLAEGRVSESGPLLFYAALKLNPEEIAAKTSRVFLGTRMECAQCHDHPFDDRIAQQDFWGFAAHFAQISRPQGKMEMTSSVLRVHDNTFGDVMIPDTATVVPPRLPDELALADPLRHDAPGMEPSRRRQLVDWLTNEHNDRFARAAVNRVWQQLFGRGLVEPVDDMRPDNAPVCPEVLDLVTGDFAASDFDLRRLLRALVLTDAYQLSSGTSNDDSSQALCFARMNMKNFTADQLYDCIAVATLSQEIDSGEALSRTDNMSRQAFLELFRTAPGDRTDYQAGVPQALTLMHGSVVHSATDLKTSGLLKSLNASFFTDQQRLDTLFLATLSREPEPAEQERLLAYLQGAKDLDEKLGILGDVLWALLNSAEFTFIH